MFMNVDRIHKGGKREGLLKRKESLFLTKRSILESINKISFIKIKSEGV